MTTIKIWDKKSDLNNIPKTAWEQAYPESAYKTLVLVDSEVLWLEDIKSQGFSGDTDVAVVESFLAKREEDRLKAEKEAQVQAEQKKSEIEKRVEEEANKIRLEYSISVAELTEKVEKDKLELAVANAELIEMVANGGIV